jgi:hypothetical protein
MAASSIFYCSAFATDEKHKKTIGSCMPSMMDHLAAACRLLEKTPAEVALAHWPGAHSPNDERLIIRPFLLIEDIDACNKKFAASLAMALIRFPFASILTASENSVLTELHRGSDSLC